ncbi:MAG TPA: 3-oxoadipate enol-lactonase [Gaiellales bacterium]|nr:3-oxoadipate enol-lactonase [Gaiellales bacterium]
MRVHHRIDGAGPGLLLVNSLGTALDLWEPQVAPLAARFRLIRYDQRGHGGTPAPEGPYTIAALAGDAIELLDRVGLERVSVCGLSIGGAVAAWIAAHAADRVERLVIGSAGPRFATPETWVERAAAVRAGGTETVVDGVLERWFTPAFAAAHAEVVDGFRATFCEVNREGYAGCCDALAEWDATPHLGRIRAPTLVIAGADDTVAPPDRGRELADAIPGARLVIIDDCAHLASANQPAAFTAAVLAHLTGEGP